MFARMRLIVLAVALSTFAAGATVAAQTLKWEDLSPPWDETRNPVTKLTQEQQDEVYEILWGPNYGDPSGKRDKHEQRAYENLKASGVDPDALFAQIEKLRAESAIRDKTLVFDLDKKVIRMPGYVLPLDFEGTKVRSFLLVPYVGACIHVPPPPPNQIVYVKMHEAFKSDELFAPVWVTGRITVGMGKKSLTLVDGTDDVAVGYSLEGTMIEPYEE